MKKIYSIICFLFILYLPVNAQSVDQIISKYVKARGGYQKLFSVHSQRLTGTILFSPNEAGPFSITMERPFKMREEMIIQGKKIIRVLNGNSGWIVNPFSGKNETQALPVSIVENMRGASDIDGPLVDYQTKGNIVRLIGKDTVNGKIAYKLRVIQGKNIISYIYIDRASGLEVKWEGEIGDKGKKHMMQSIFSNYRKVDGVMYACKIVSSTPGTNAQQIIIIKKVEVNPKLNEKIFSKPELEEKPTPKKINSTKQK